MGKTPTEKTSEVYARKPRSPHLDNALEYARKGCPVLPIKDKQPLTSHGVYSASSDPARVAQMFKAAPNATGYGIRTGKASGLVVLDIDSPEALAEARRRGLPPTFTVKTARGWHLYYLLPKGLELASHDAAPGLEVKAERCYVAGAGSVHPARGRYTVESDAPLAPAPEWMLKERGGANNSVATSQKPRSSGPIDLDNIGEIFEGKRDTTLTSLAGSLHDGTRDLEVLTRDLQGINEAWCKPPISSADVARIARSTHKKPPCRVAHVRPETLEALALVEAEFWRRPWSGMGGKSERDTFAALIKKARHCGVLIPSGVRVSVDVRTLALEAGLSKTALLDYWRKGKRKPGVISRLKRAGLIRSDNARRGAREAGAFVLLLPAAQSLTTQPCGVGGRDTVACGQTLRSPRLRWGYPGIKRIGKTRGALIDTLERAGGADAPNRSLRCSLPR